LDSDENGKPDVAIRWHQIADFLKHEQIKDDIGVISKYLLEQFYVYLKGQNMVLSKVKSDISEGLNAYRSKVGDVAKSLQRMRNFEKLDTEVSLRPLSNLLKLMKESFRCINAKPRFESGQKQGGWTGLVFNHLESLFYIYYSQPETVIFETYNLTIDADRFDGNLGRLRKEGKRLMWKNELNIAETGFLSSNRIGQFEILERFLKQSYDCSKTLESNENT